MVSGMCPSDAALAEWFNESAEQLMGAHHENLAALLGDDYERQRAWEQATAAYDAILKLASQKTQQLTVVLLVPLQESARLLTSPPLGPPSTSDLHPLSPPSFVVDGQTVAQRWRPFEEYRRPLSWDLSLESQGSVRGMYVSFRSVEDERAGAPYARQLIFERLLDHR
jgi:hypothetical protein